MSGRRKRTDVMVKITRKAELEENKETKGLRKAEERISKRPKGRSREMQNREKKYKKEKQIGKGWKEGRAEGGAVCDGRGCDGRRGDCNR